MRTQLGGAAGQKFHGRVELNTAREASASRAMNRREDGATNRGDRS